MASVDSALTGAARLARHEVKVPLERIQHQELAPVFIKLGISPRTAYPDRIIHSVYLDTPGFDDYNDNVSGVSVRSKTRVRWYDDDIANLALEVKGKRAKVSQKTIARFENPNNVPPHGRGIVTLARARLAASAPATLRDARVPTLEARYRRSYFELTPDIRMTVDRDMRYRGLYPSVRLRWIRSPVDVVLEFKFPVHRGSELARILRHLPFRVFRHSKYVVGLDTAGIG